MPERIVSGKFVIQEEIARGGMGVIYKALDRRLNRPVAIKVLHSHFSGDPPFIERFLREARAMARLDHENIIRIHAVEEEQGATYLVMEYFLGSNLRTLIRGGRRLPLHEVLNISTQLTNALAYAHGHGIIHRDIKPANIMVNARGKTKLADFGIAAALDEASITSTGQVIGTPEYMSPEQARGQEIDGRSDLYSLGMVIYEMLVGQTPFHNIPKTSILGKLIHDNEDFVLNFPDNVPSDLRAIMEDLLRKEPNYRTPDARTLLSQLTEFSRTLPSSSVGDDNEPTIISTTGTTQRRTTRATQPVPPVSTPPPTLPRPETLERIPTPPRTRPTDPVNPSAAPVDLEETDILPPSKPPAEPSTRSPVGLTLRAYKILPLVAGVLGSVLLLAGITYYLSTHSVPSEESRDISRKSDLPAGQQVTQRDPGQQSQSTSDAQPVDPQQRRAAEKSKLEEEQRRLTEDKARLEAKRREADALRVKQEAEQKRIRAGQERAAKEKELTTERAREEAERRRKAEEEARLARERHEAELKRLQAEKDRVEKDKEMAAQRARTEAEQRRKAEEEARLAGERQEAEQKRLQAERERAERDKELAALRAKEETERKRIQAEREKELAAQRAREAEQKRLQAERERAEKEKRQADEEVVSPKEQRLAKRYLAPDRQLQTLLANFKNAYENRDMKVLQQMSQMSSERQRNLELMFENYRTIQVSIQNVLVTEEGASATVTLDHLVKNSGELVRLSPIARTIRIQITKDKAGWTTIVW